MNKTGPFITSQLKQWNIYKRIGRFKNAQNPRINGSNTLIKLMKPENSSSDLRRLRAETRYSKDVIAECHDVSLGIRCLVYLNTETRMVLRPF